jgi:hypothetical protein
VRCETCACSRSSKKYVELCRYLTSRTRLTKKSTSRREASASHLPLAARWSVGQHKMRKRRIYRETDSVGVIVGSSISFFFVLIVEIEIFSVRSKREKKSKDYISCRYCSSNSKPPQSRVERPLVPPQPIICLQYQV